MEKLADFLIDASTKLGVQATRIWPDLVKIVWIQCLLYSIIAVITIVACYRAIRILIGIFTQSLGGEPRLLAAIGIGILSAIAIFAAMTLSDNLPGVFFPEAKYVSFLVNKFAASK